MWRDPTFVIGLVLFFLSGPLNYFSGNPKILYFGALGLTLLVWYGAYELVSHLERSRLPKVEISSVPDPKSKAFAILAVNPITPPPDDLKGLAWDGRSLWFSGRSGGQNGVFRLAVDFTATSAFKVDGAWVYGIVSNQNLFVVAQMMNNQKYEIREYSPTGTFIRAFPSPIIPQGSSPGCFTFDGTNYWFGVDVGNVLYRLSDRFEVTATFPLTHRILGATFAANSLWITDASTIYRYDLQLKQLAEYPCRGCGGMAFDGQYLWSINVGGKEIRRQKFL